MLLRSKNIPCFNLAAKLLFLVLITVAQLSLGYRPETIQLSSRAHFRSQYPSGGAPVNPPQDPSDPPQPAQPNSIIGDDYDFIIVGGGTAGCALARRLSESGEHSVLVLEYGDYPDPGLDIPALFGEYLNDENRKVYRTVAQSNGGLSNNGTFNYLVGRQLGGTSGLNGMFFNRGSPHNYDEWATLTGDSSWNYSNLMKYFRKLEDYQGDFSSNGQHGFGGPITVSRPRFVPGLEQWLEAGSYLGYPVADPNGPQQVSVTPVEFSKRFGRRVSSYTGYLRPLMLERRQLKLKVTVKAEVKRIIFAGNRAVGVTYRERDGWGPNIPVRAKKEIILSAGTINSPVILMKSGIGPRGMLESARIPVLRSLPVGKNLHDHMVFRLSMILGNRSATFIPERDLTPENFRLYNETGDGPYASYQGTPGQVFTPSSRSAQKDWADIQISFLQSPGAASVLPGGSNQDIHIAPSEVLVSCAVYLVGPKSRGYLTLNNTHLDQGDPILNFRYLDHPDDIQIMKEAIKTTLTIFEDTPVYQKMGARYPPNPHPSCSHLQFRSDPYWECLIRHVAGSGSHGAGSCRMGKGNGDPEAVVNPQLKVLGFQNLRVVDASIMPRVTNANTQAPVYVIAEKAAEMILNSWK